MTEPRIIPIPPEDPDHARAVASLTAQLGTLPAAVEHVEARVSRGELRYEVHIRLEDGACYRATFEMRRTYADHEWSWESVDAEEVA